MRYNTCLTEVSDFYWTTEKKLVHTILKDRANSATDTTSLFQSLCDAWIDSGHSQDICNLYRSITAQRSALQLYAILIAEQDI